MVSEFFDLDKQPIAEQVAIADEVPIIDITDLLIDSSSDAAAAAVEQVAQACQTWGFFQVINHGISQDLFDRVWQQTRHVFALAVEDKQAIMRSKDNPWGYYNNELTKNQRDKKEIYDYTREGIDPIYGKSNRWPLNQPEFKASMVEYFDACTRLSLTLLEAFCVGLGLPARYLHPDFESNHTGFMRLNYYPVKDPMAGQDLQHMAEADLGVHHHTDAGGLTVLIQDEVGGLQVYKDGYWYDIPPTKGALVINTGDMMQVWSNDIYKAPVHRVLAMKSTDRYSLPFFFNPSASSQVSPLPSVINDQQPSRYHSIEWARFRGKRSEGDYADYGTEVQISQFRMDNSA